MHFLFLVHATYICKGRANVLYIYIYMYVCIYVCVYVCVYVYIYL